MLAHPVAVAIEIEDNTAVQELAQDGGRHHGVVEEFPHEPTCKLVVEQMSALQVSLVDDLEDSRRQPPESSGI